MNKNRVFRELGEGTNALGLQTGADKRKALGSSPVLAPGLGRSTIEHQYKVKDGKVTVLDPIDVVRARDLR